MTTGDSRNVGFVNPPELAQPGYTQVEATSGHIVCVAGQVALDASGLLRYAA